MSAELAEQPTDATGGRCGTYAGWNIHVREGIEMCTPCRKANADYMREYRARKGPGYDDQYSAARNRALTRLAHLHPGQFKILLDEERGR